MKENDDTSVSKKKKKEISFLFKMFSKAFVNFQKKEMLTGNFSIEKNRKKTKKFKADCNKAQDTWARREKF